EVGVSARRISVPAVDSDYFGERAATGRCQIGGIMRHGLKHVSHRRNDALAQVKWDRLEHLLADHYRAQGYDVDHVGTGGAGGRFDGGIDLKLRREGEYVVVQVK